MTPIAPHITAFLRERLPLQRGASEHTCDSYAYAFQLLFQFASARLRVTPSALCLEQIDAALIMDFLQSNPLCGLSSIGCRRCWNKADASLPFRRNEPTSG